MTALPNALALQRRARWERLGLVSLIAPAFLLILLTMLVPVSWLFYLSVLSDAGAFSLEHYQRMWDQPSYGRTFVTTFKVSLQTTVICILLGYPLAYFLSELPKRVATLARIPRPVKEPRVVPTLLTPPPSPPFVTCKLRSAV